MSPAPTLKVTVKVPGKTTPVDLGSLPLSTSSSHLLELLEKKGNVAYRILDLLSREREKRVVVTDGEDSCVVRTGLRINTSTSFAQFYNAYLRSVNDVRANSPFPVIISNGSIQMGPLNIIPERTIRVPTDNQKHLLPPGLGTFPLLPVRSYPKEDLPGRMKASGGAFMPMYQNEALWLYFQHQYPGAKYALKVSCGNINAITGRSKSSKTIPGTQDYVSTQQPWLDGVCTDPEVVRQFVAVPLGSKHSIEQQLTGKDQKGGIQAPPWLVGDELLATPTESGLAVGSTIFMLLASQESPPTSRSPLSLSTPSTVTFSSLLGTSSLFQSPFSLPEESCSRSKLDLSLRSASSAPKSRNSYEFLEASNDSPTSRPSSITTLFSSEYSIPAQATIKLGLVLKGGFCLPSSPLQTQMSMAAGGQIRQKIYADETDPRKYDRKGTRVHLHVVNSADYRRITGKKPPPFPVSEKTYKKHGLPFFELYDEKIPATNSLPNPTLSSVRPVPGEAEDSSHPKNVVGIHFKDLEDIDWVSPPAY